MKIKNYSLPKITCLVILVIAVITLFVIRAGIADNGLLSATLTDIGLYDHQSASGSGYFADSFGVASKEIGKGSGGLVYGIIKAFLPVDGVLFVYIPAIIYLLLFLIGIYLVLKNSLCGNFGNNVLMCLLSAVIIADSGYVMFFNTPYTEASFISFLAMFIGSFMAYSNKRKKVYLLLAGVFACLIGSLGIYYAALGILLGLSLLAFSKERALSAKILSVLMSVLVISASLFGFTVEKDSDINRYNRVFYGVLTVAENKAEALKDLGIDEKYADFANVPFFEEKAVKLINSSEFDEIYTKADIKNIAKYYLSHPKELKQGLKLSAQNSTSIRCKYLGNFSSSSNKPFYPNTIFGIYNSLKSRIIPASLPFILVFFIGVIALGLGFMGKFKSKKGIVLTT